MVTLAKGTWWRQHRDGPIAERLHGIVYASSNWVTVGENAGSPVILTVPTANEQDVAPTFTTRSAGGTDPLNAVDYVSNNDVVIACGDNGVIETSSDQGASWSTQNLAGNPDLFDVKSDSRSAGTQFSAAGVDEIWARTTGGVWTQRWSGSQTWRTISFLPTPGAWFVAGDNGYGAYSATGAAGTWSAPFSFAISTIRKARANLNYVIAIGDDGLVWRSATGQSGSFAQVSGFGFQMKAIVPLADTLVWAAFGSGNESWISVDDGATWTRNLDSVTQVLDADDKPTRVTTMVCGEQGDVAVSYEQTQADYVAPAQEIQTPEAAFGANDDMAGDAVRRLVTQFRSGRG